MSFAIAHGCGSRAELPYVSVTIYGERDGEGVSPEEAGIGAGAIYCAADAAWEVDPWGTPRWILSKDTYRYNEKERRDAAPRPYIYHRLEFEVSCFDVTKLGPIHRQRAWQVADAMYRALRKVI